MYRKSRSPARAALRRRLSLLAAGLVLAGSVLAQGTAVPIDIAAQPLDKALAALARQTGAQIVFSTTLAEGRPAPAIKGSLTVREALERLLAGSGLGVKTTDERTFAVVQLSSAAAPETSLPTVRVTARSATESATGPVAGYAARRSATATKTDTPLLETPQSISIVTAEQIEDTKAMSVAEALAYTPGVMHDPGYSNSYDVMYSRGFRLHDGNGGVYRDGLRLGASGWATGQQEIYGMERVELLKGAASVLFGAAAPGGVLNIVTKQPGHGNFNEVKVEAGNYSHRAAAADLGRNLSEQWSARVVMLVRNSDTMVDHIPNDSTYFAPSLRWSPGPKTSLTLLAHYQERRTAYIYGVPVEGSLIRSPHGEIPRERFVGEPDFDRQDTRQHAVGYLFNHEFSDALTLRHGLRYMNSRNHVRFTGLDGADPGNDRLWLRSAYDELETTRGVSADTSLQYRFQAAGMQHTVLAGTDQSRHRIGSRWECATLAPLDMFDPVYGAEPGSFSSCSDSRETQQRVGVYLQDQAKYGRLTVLLGGRQDWVRSKPEGGDTERTKAFTGRAGIVYEVVKGLAPFASFSQSFEPQTGVDNDGERYEPTRGEQVELGLRWQGADEGLLVSGSLFRLKQTNVLSERAGLPRPVQTGEVLSKGVELEAKGRLTRHVSTIASWSHIDSEIRKSEVASEVGSPTAGTPKRQAALWLKSRGWPVPGLQLGFGARHVGRTQDWNGTNTRVPSFTTFDALVGYVTGPWNLSLNVNNVADKDTMVCSYGYCVYGDGRRATLSLAYRW